GGGWLPGGSRAGTVYGTGEPGADASNAGRPQDDAAAPRVHRSGRGGRARSHPRASVSAMSGPLRLAALPLLALAAAPVCLLGGLPPPTSAASGPDLV